MKCKLIFYCALVFYLEAVASLPYAFNVPSYPIKHNAETLPRQYIYPQNYWNQGNYNDDSYNYPNKQYEELPRVNRDQNYAYRQQGNKFHNNLGYVKRYSSSEQTNPNWSLQKEWKNLNRETVKKPIQTLPEIPLTIEEKQYFNFQDTQNQLHKVTTNHNNLRESSLRRPLVTDNNNKIHNPNKIVHATMEMYNPPIPGVPSKSMNQAAIEKFDVLEKNIPIKNSIERKEENKSKRKILNDSDERFFASSTNPIETYPTSTPDPIKNHIKQVMSNFKVRQMILSRKSPSRYLVVYPNGTIERVNTLQTIAKQHPNYVLVHAGNMVAKPIQNIDQIETASTTATAILQNSESKKESPRKDLSRRESLPKKSLPKDSRPKEYSPKDSHQEEYLPKHHQMKEILPKESLPSKSIPKTTNSNIIPIDIQQDVSSSSSIDLSPASSKIEPLPNSSLASDSVPLRVNLIPDNETLPIEIPPRTVVQLLLPVSTPKNENKTLFNAESVEIPSNGGIISNISVIPVGKPSKDFNASVTNNATKTIEQVPIVNSSEEEPFYVEQSPVSIEIESPPKTIANMTLPKDMPLEVPPNILQVGFQSVELPTFVITASKNLTTATAAASVTKNIPTPDLVDEVKPDLPKETEKTNKEEIPKILQTKDDALKNSSLVLGAVAVASLLKESSSTETLSTTTVTPITDQTKQINTTDTLSTTLFPVNENNDTNVLPSSIKPILLNVPENKTISNLPGNLDISKVKSEDKPLVWFRTTDESFWNKLANGNNDFDIVYFFQINTPPKVENDISRTIYPNGTIIEVLTKKLWDPDSGKPTVSKTTRVIPPNSAPIV